VDAVDDAVFIIENHGVLDAPLNDTGLQFLPLLLAQGPNQTVEKSRKYPISNRDFSLRIHLKELLLHVKLVSYDAQIQGTALRAEYDDSELRGYNCLVLAAQPLTGPHCRAASVMPQVGEAEGDYGSIASSFRTKKRGNYLIRIRSSGGLVFSVHP
jgi:hypothetical protein